MMRFLASLCKLIFYLFLCPLSGLGALLAACDGRALLLVSEAHPVEHLVPSALFLSALCLLGHYLQYPHDL